MSEIKITENTSRSNNVIYVKNALNEIFERVGANVDFKTTKHRAELTVNAPENYFDLIVAEVEDKLADVIAVSYKYDYFKRKITVNGLSSDEKELLLTALISADLDEDKRYVYKKIKAFKEFAIDGIFNFRMQQLKQKWKEIIDYIPIDFNLESLKEFISYIVKDKQNKKVYYENGKVYDKHYNELNKSKLLSDNDRLKVVEEILLSGAGQIELISALPDLDGKFLKDFYQDKISFATDYY